MNTSEFKSLLVRQCAIDLKKPVLVGFSGGPDSLCLLSLLIGSGVEVIAAHLDHALRPGSAGEATYVKEVCARLGVRGITGQVDVQEYARRQHLSVEEAARNARYTFLFGEAKKERAQAVLTGHHADDQVETVLMHFLRGSALSGLAGMRRVLVPNPWSNTIPLIRPLLGYTREEIEAYLRGIDIKPITDESNQDTGYLRNRIRHELVPLLSTYNPQIRERVMRMAEVIAREDDLITEETRRVWSEVILEEGKGYLVCDRQKSNALHPALLRRLVRRAITWMDHTLRDIDHTVIEKGSSFFADSGESNRVDLIAGIEMFIHLKDQVVFARVDDALHSFWPQLTRDVPLPIQIPGETQINDLWTLRADIQPAYQEVTDAFTCQLDGYQLPGDLVIRRFKPGDRFTPYGSGAQPMKLGDFWTNQGLAVRARPNWPIVRCGAEVVWVPGFRIAERFKVKEETGEIIRLKLSKT